MSDGSSCVIYNKPKKVEMSNMDNYRINEVQKVIDDLTCNDKNTGTIVIGGASIKSKTLNVTVDKLRAIKYIIGMEDK